MDNSSDGSSKQLQPISAIKRQLAFLSLPLLFTMFLSTPALADTEVFSNQRICDAKLLLCIRASLVYDNESQRLQLQGRVMRAQRSGTLIVRVNGTDKFGKNHKIKLKSRLKGKYSELINLESKKIKSEDIKIAWEYKPIVYK